MHERWIHALLDDIDRLNNRVSTLTGCMLVMAAYQLIWIVGWAVGLW